MPPPGSEVKTAHDMSREFRVLSALQPYYASIPKFDDIKYFEFYFDRPIYSGKTLMSHITEGCIIFPLLKIMLESPLTPEQFQSIYEETNATSL
jgi:hypothetical protein